MQTQANGRSSDGARLIPYGWELLILLWLAFFLHQADRQIFNNLLPLIRTDLRLSDVQLGMVASVFTVVFGLCVLAGGYAADVWRRKWIILVSLLVWSTATLLTGISTGILALLVFRGLASGGGEGFYYPAAASLTSRIARCATGLASMAERNCASMYSTWRPAPIVTPGVMR